jgi:diguanylate cyclase (GGDEF)-like protein
VNQARSCQVGEYSAEGQEVTRDLAFLPSTLDVAAAGVGELAEVCPVIDGDRPVGEVDDLFRGNRELRSVIVRAGPRLALLSRDHVNFELTGPFGYGRSLHARSRIADLLPAEELVVPASIPLTSVARLILDRPSISRYQDVLVLAADGSGRVAPVSRVFEALSHVFRHVAMHDPLTGLPNRRLLDERAAELTGGGMNLTRVAVLYVDLDGFKDVNDTHGHQVGDELLLAFADRLAGCVRPPDVVARLGGDEFGVLLVDVSEVQALAIADRIVLTASAPFVLDEEPITLSASVGVALAGDVRAESRLTALDVLLRHADSAMLHAKATGKCRVSRLDSEAASSAPLRRAAVRRRLRQALTRGELTLHYQPILDLAAGDLDVVEALLRWTDHELGVITPAEFIPIAESSGQIVEIGTWVLHQACDQARRWLDQGVSWVVAINMSPVQFAVPGLADQVLQALAERSLPASLLRIEITEGVAIADLPGTREQLRILRDAGIGIALDDFGTGYSSMAMLRGLPITAIKIDKAFIDDIDTDTLSARFVAGVIEAAHSLGLRVTAEGIERPEQVVRLRELGCDSAQGYLIARPASLAELPAIGPTSH